MFKLIDSIFASILSFFGNIFVFVFRMTDTIFSPMETKVVFILIFVVNGVMLLSEGGDASGKTGFIYMLLAVALSKKVYNQFQKVNWFSWREVKMVEDAIERM